MLAPSQHGLWPRRNAGAAGLPLRGVVVALFCASAVLNLLALNGSLFMLQVYDRVLASRSIPTLVALCVLSAGLFGFQALLDSLRARLLLRLGESADARLSACVMRAIARLPLMSRGQGDGLQPLRDLDTIRSFFATPGPAALFDLPWIPVYLAICFLFHFWIGVTALAGTVVMVAITVFADVSARRPARIAAERGAARSSLAEQARRNAESLQAMGFADRILDRWQVENDAYLAANRSAGDTSGTMSAISRAIRQALQSAILAVGAWLVIQQEASAGVMIASSIMMGRTMAPVDSAIGSWRSFVAARQGWARLRKLEPVFQEAAPVLDLPAPCRDLRAEGLVIAPPTAAGSGVLPTVTDISFRLAAGSALGVIGASGSGKSTLVRALTGVWPLLRGHVRLDGAALDQYGPEALGRHTGYLPQQAELFEGTVAENIARFDPDAAPEAIIAAAEAAGVHGFVTSLPQGYQTRIGHDGAGLSGGQRQRIGLARALYGNPFLLVLDEPNANLDADGEAAVVEVMKRQRERGGIAIVVAHRPSALGAVDHVLMMEAGRMKAFGPRDEVLSRVLKGAPAVRQPGAGFGSMSARLQPPLKVVAAQAGVQAGTPADAGADKEAAE